MANAAFVKRTNPQFQGTTMRLYTTNLLP